MSADRLPEHPDGEAVWRDMRASLLGFIARRVSDPGSAEDIVQDVLLRIHRHVDELSRVTAVSGWIHEIARNAIIDYYRRAVVRRERPVGSEVEIEQPITDGRPFVILDSYGRIGDAWRNRWDSPARGGRFPAAVWRRH